MRKGNGCASCIVLYGNKDIVWATGNFWKSFVRDQYGKLSQASHNVHCGYIIPRVSQYREKELESYSIQRESEDFKIIPRNDK